MIEKAWEFSKKNLYLAWGVFLSINTPMTIQVSVKNNKSRSWWAKTSFSIKVLLNMDLLLTKATLAAEWFTSWDQQEYSKEWIFWGFTPLLWTCRGHPTPCRLSGTGCKRTKIAQLIIFTWKHLQRFLRWEVQQGSRQMHFAGRWIKSGRCQFWAAGLPPA